MQPLSIMRGAETYFHRGTTGIGCLCLHGFTASPHEVLWLGQHLAEHGHTVIAPRIAGHGTHAHHLATTTWQDWYFSALDAYHILQQSCDYVIVGGLSMGALLSLLISMEAPVKGVYVLAAPLILNKNFTLRYIRWLKYLQRYTDQTDRSPFAQYIEEQQTKRGEAVIGRVRYNQWSSHAVHELMKLVDATGQRLSGVTAPILSIYSENDATVPLSSEQYLRQTVSSREKTHHILKQSGHILTQDVEHESVFSLVSDFVQNCADAT